VRVLLGAGKETVLSGAACEKFYTQGQSVRRGAFGLRIANEASEFELRLRLCLEHQVGDGRAMVAQDKE